MITHAINKYVAPVRKRAPVTGKGKFKGVLGGLDHKMFILERAYTSCNLVPNDIVIYKKVEYVVNDVYGPSDINWITWKGLSPEFVELIDSDGVYMYVNPGVLRKVGQKRRK